MAVKTYDLERGTPLKKRAKTSSEAPPTSANPSRRLFAPFRALGLVTNHVPFVLQTRSFKGSTDGARSHILTCTGRSWCLWEGGKMTLLFVGQEAPYLITHIALDGDAVWASAGPHVIKYLRGKEVGRLTNPLGSHLAFILIFGKHILALTEEGSRMLIWDTESMSMDPLGTIEFENGFTASSMLHPATYLNKVLVASGEGSMQLWNIRTRTCIHKYARPSLRDNHDPNSPCAITALTQSPAIDVVGIGFSTGEISLYDIRADERLMRIYMDGGPIRGLSFRSDGESVLASASASGHVAVWDLNNNGRLLHVVRGAHDRAVSAIEWIPNQPVLISSGEDNSVKQWLMESPDSPPRLLKFRSGHHEPPHLIRYYGDDGKQLLSSSRDRSFRCTSIVRDSRSFELSQGSLTKKASAISTPVADLKLPPVSQLSFSTTRAKDWDDILTAHKHESVARTWCLREKKLGKWVMNLNEDGLSNPRDKKKKKMAAGTVKAVAVSACGNYGLAGAASGVIHMYNMQSGIHRKSYDVGPCPPKLTTKLRGASGERGICGLSTDSLNRLVIAATYDGTINFFDFHSQALLHTLVLPSTCSSITLQRDSGLLAVICDDLTVRLVDIETCRVVREMSGFSGNVLDLAFSPDSRWLITTSLDSMIRTFDIPSGRLIDVFRTSSIATSIAFSPTNDFLATAHVDSVGVFLWANRAQYADVSLSGVVESDDLEIALPSIQEGSEVEALDALQALTLDENTDVYSTPTQLGGDLITLTLLPRARWQSLLKLDVIQQRNKPKEPPKAPEKAPFFLPTLPGVEHRFAVTKPNDADVANASISRASESDNKSESASVGRGKNESKDTKQSKRLEMGATQTGSTFYRKLVSEDPEGDYEAFFSYAKTLTPAALDLELRSLVNVSGTSPSSSLEALRILTNAFSRRLRSHRDFEGVQAMMGATLNMHGEIFVNNAGSESGLGEALEGLRDVQREESRRVLEVVEASLGALSFVRDVL